MRDPPARDYFSRLVVTMKDQEKSTEQLIDELQAARRRLAELEVLVAGTQGDIKRLSMLATFPEQNPNLVIEINQNGTVTYLNPVAQHRFPELWERGFHHRLLRHVPKIIAILKQDGQEYIAREVDLGNAVYEQKVCYLKEDHLIRIFSHDITARKRAEEAVQQMAEQLRGLARRVVMAQEEERQRVSRELHDEAGQALTALKISLELIAESLPPDAAELRQNLHEAVALTHTTRQRIRLLAQGLHPPVLDTLGINAALEGLCRDFSRRTQILINYQGRDIPTQLDAIHVCLYRFLQEALTNVAEHAGATQVWVSLDLHGAHISLSVQDNGRGLDGETETFPAQHASGMGWLGMRERLRLLDGRLEIDSKPDMGTRVVAHLPIESTI